VKTVVVDASVAVCWFVREAGSLAANQLVRNDVHMIAPSLILPELANAVWKKWRRGQMDAAQTEIAVREINRFVPEIVDMAKLIEPALTLARETGHSVYDCLYVTLARQRDLQLVTLDQKLVAAFAGARDASRVALIDDWLQAS
jgi:predicted nucleic acid-binding protein